MNLTHYQVWGREGNHGFSERVKSTAEFLSFTLGSASGCGDPRINPGLRRGRVPGATGCSHLIDHWHSSEMTSFGWGLSQLGAEDPWARTLDEHLGFGGGHTDCCGFREVRGPP